MGEYQVIISGALLDNTNRQEALMALQSQFGLPAQTAETLLNGTAKVIKKNIDQETALRYQQRFQAIGIVCEVRATSVAAATNPPPQKTPPPSPRIPGTPSKVNATSNGEVITSSPDHPGYPFKIEGRPDYSFLTVQLPAGQTLKVEASAMATMDSHIQMKTKLKGGLSRFLTGESLFVNEFTATGGPGEIGIAPGPPGDLIHYYLNGDTIYLQNSAFVASAPGVELETKWQGLTKGFFSGESLFLIRCSGKGDLWFNTYGAMFSIDVTGDYVVDTGHIVAFTEGLDYQVTKVGGYKSLFFSGEGFVCRFSGQGKVWIQTRMAGAFINWAHFFRPVKKSN